MGRRRVGLVFSVWAFLLLVAVFGVVLNVPLVGGSGTIYIKADGSVDPPDAPISTADNITYTFTGNINDSIVVERDNIVVDGAGYTVQGSGIKGSIYWNRVAIGIELRGFNVTLKNTKATQFDFGIRIAGFGNNTLINNTVSNNTFGVYLATSNNNILYSNNATNNFGYWEYDPYVHYVDGRGILLVNSKNNTLIYNIALNNGYGITLSGLGNNTLSGNSASDNKYNFGVFGDNFSDFNNYVDTSNTVDGNPIYYLIGATNAVYGAETNAGTVYLINSNNITIRDLILIKNFYGVYLWNTTDSKIENVTTIKNNFGIQLYNSNNNIIWDCNTSNNMYGIYLYGSNNNTLSGNNASSNNDHGILIGASRSNILAGNIASNNRREGIAASQSSYNVLSGNTVTSNRGDYAIIVGSHSVLDDNNISSNHAIGICLAGSNNTLHGNNISNNAYGVVDRSPHGSNNTLSGNNIANNAYGIYLTGSNNILFSNNISSHYIGICLDWSTNNRIFHNNFINNTKQARLSNSNNNTWDDGYPSGGNYWSDYTGIDEKSGPDQNQTGSDGIGDTAYIIDANNQDMYPLMYLWPDTTPPTTINDYDWLWHTVDFTVILTAVDDKSGVKATHYNINDGPIKTVSTDGQPIIDTESADNTLEYWSVDNVGNEESPHNVLSGITLDKTSPTGSISVNNDAAYTNSCYVMLTLTAIDATSGVAQMRFSHNNVTWIPWEAYTTYKEYALTMGDETKTIYVQYMDNAGLISPSYQDTIILDTTQPKANAGVDQTVTEDTLVTLNGSVSQDENGIASYMWTFTDVTPQTMEGENPTYNFTTLGTYIVTLTVEDAAGNTATDTVTITTLLDTDGDQTPDITDPDDDNDGIPDAWEIENELDPLDAADASLDPDGDGITNLEEYQGGTNPNVSDAEAFPLWTLATAVTLIGIAAAATYLWRRRRK